MRPSLGPLNLPPHPSDSESAPLSDPSAENPPQSQPHALQPFAAVDNVPPPVDAISIPAQLPLAPMNAHCALQAGSITPQMSVLASPLHQTSDSSRGGIQTAVATTNEPLAEALAWNPLQTYEREVAALPLYPGVLEPSFDLRGILPAVGTITQANSPPLGFDGDSEEGQLSFGALLPTQFLPEDTIPSASQQAAFDWLVNDGFLAPGNSFAFNGHPGTPLQLDNVDNNHNINNEYYVNWEDWVTDVGVQPTNTESTPRPVLGNVTNAVGSHTLPLIEQSSQLPKPSRSSTPEVPLPAPPLLPVSHPTFTIPDCDIPQDDSGHNVVEISEILVGLLGRGRGFQMVDRWRMLESICGFPGSRGKVRLCSLYTFRSPLTFA